MFMKMNSMINNFSVVIPVFNEEEIFLESADKIFKICQEMNMPFEIIFSENGSLDNTKNLIRDFIEDKDNCFMINSNYANYGLALKNGFKNAKNELVISFDIDYFSKQFLEQAIQLDEKFDIREFHNQILNSGSLPLVLLEKKIEDWIKTQM